MAGKSEERQRIAEVKERVRLFFVSREVCHVISQFLPFPGGNPQSAQLIGPI